MNNPLKFVDPSGYSTYYIDGLPWYGMNDHNFEHYRNNNISNISTIENNGYTVYNSQEYNQQILKDVYRLFKYGSSGYSARYMEYDQGWALQFGRNNEVLTEPNNFLSRRDVLEVKSLFKYIGKIGEDLANSGGDGNSLTGLFVASGGAGIIAGEKTMYNNDTWLSIKKWKAYSTKTTPGNFYTGWRSGAKKISTGFKIFGYGLGAYNSFSIYNQYKAGEIDQTGMLVEQGSNLFSTAGGLYGAAWGIGWEAGKNYGPSTWWGNPDVGWWNKLW